CAMLAACLQVEAAPHRRALLIGINDYTASTLAAHPRSAPAPGRDWPNLGGAVNDVNTMRDMLVALYGFDRNGIVTLTDQAATREAILVGIEQLVNAAAKDDVILFYYAGHGSQVRNSLSEERDKLDESLVPADSRIGAADIRDKELRMLFNRVLDRGARLTVILDNCHSSSGARGLGTGAQPRGVKPDLRDVADGVSVPRPESRGALVLAATQDVDAAWETRDAEGKFRGAFSWAWMRSMRDAASGEPAMETFLRAQARMRAETPFQQPTIAGTVDTRMAPFLGTRTDRRDDRIVVAAQKVRGDGTVLIEGGWANGLSVGTELRAAAARLTVTALRGVTECEARLQSGTMPSPGALLEVSAWAAPPVRPLRIWTPRSPHTLKDIATMARSLSSEAAQHGVRWITDPIDVTPTHLLRWSGSEWELLSEGATEHLGQNTAAIAAMARLSPGSTLFVQFPAPETLVDRVAAEGVEQATTPEEADYVLAGRFTGHHLSYAWVRPSVKKSDRRKTGLPVRTAWIAERKNNSRLRDTAPALHAALLTLRRIHGWQLLESPPSDRFPYRLAARRARDGMLVTDGGAIIGGERYELVLRAISQPLPARIPKRFIYAFVVDSNGKSTLLFPPPSAGSVENQFEPHETEIALGEPSAFGASPPYGVDTYFLLTTEEPLPNPSVLEWDGVRAPEAFTPLEQLLLQPTRAIGAVPTKWSITKTTFESLAPHAKAMR
ncbi:MAG TPA: caspase family protein, partial [Thermoanaerobaculia bacterium]|nr:caspase family protein [Thermoanaerobaculia bacterium]